MQFSHIEQYTTKNSQETKGNYSRRINIQHRLVYAVLPDIAGYDDLSGSLADGIVLVKRMWTHYA